LKAIKRNYLSISETNSEIALIQNDQLVITSAAGGPAFEGAGLKAGMFAEPGGNN